jgi:hypothetical protein
LLPRVGCGDLPAFSTRESFSMPSSYKPIHNPEMKSSSRVAYYSVNLAYVYVALLLDF